MFVGERIRLRPQRREDSDMIARFQSDADLLDNYVMSNNLPPTRESIDKWYERMIDNRDGFSFVIETHEGLFIGCCFTMLINWKDGTTYVAIYIGRPDYRNLGYGTEAMELMLNFLFNELGLRKAKLNVFSFNKRAIRCYEKVGFTINGINKKELYRNGEYHDNFAMSITRDVFNIRKII